MIYRWALRTAGAQRNEDSIDGESDSCKDDLELRGGAGGSAATTRKRQVTDAVQQMQEILNGLLTQPDGENDEVGVLGQRIEEEAVKKWEHNKPTKDEVRDNLAKIH